ncbi:MAG TPA: ABC transporter permease [Planctomycetota bacterium]|jgi:putative ABC transport system permease protein|nr:ABC transporter permease [Planctomycetota bacterium]
MKFANLSNLAWRNLGRRKLRTALTIGGVAVAVLLLVLVESLASGLDDALSGSEAARTLIVYRQNRYCPQTSFLPQDDAAAIARVPGVQSVLPVKIFLSNCRASLDVIAFHGVPAKQLFDARRIELLEGDRAAFEARGDAALLGKGFAARRHLSVGDRFRFGGFEVTVAGIYASSEPIQENLIVTHLEFLQRNARVNQQGTVTEFEVKVDDPKRAKEIAAEIDKVLASSSAPTDTRLEQAFLESATADLREILRFGRLFGLGCVLVVLVVVANTVAMAVGERVRELAVMRTLGYREGRLARLIVGESLLLAAAGAALGFGGALLVIRFTALSIGVEGVLVSFSTSPALFVRAFAVAAIAGVAAAALPAWRATRSEVAAALRGAA